MGDQMIDIVLFALAAGFFLYQLWRVLGRRTGVERPPQLPSAANVSRPAASVFARLRPPVAPTPDIQTPSADGVQQILKADPSFQREGFIDGARHAFEIIVKAYAEGDTATLRPLVSDEVYDTFAESIRHRLAVKETVDTRVVRLQDPEIVEAAMNGRTAVVSVKFVSSQTSVTRAVDNSIIEGDPDRPVERTDTWTFSRNTRSNDPNWVLIATGSPE